MPFCIMYLIPERLHILQLLINGLLMKCLLKLLQVDGDFEVENFDYGEIPYF